MDHSTHEEYQQSISKNLAKWLKRRARAPKPALVEAALLLIRLNLDPLIPMLGSLSSSSPRGRPPFDPVCMFRALLLMALLRYTSITVFAQDLRRTPRLALLAGFASHQTPSVGAFYLFIDRLEDGPFQPQCPHRVPLSSLRKGSHLRNLKQEKVDQEARRQQILAECDSITRQLKGELLSHASQPRPNDFLKRLEDALILTAVTPSAHRGLLGKLSRMIVGGDGSALVTGASPLGKPSCQCRKAGNYSCSCPRFYSDPTADWGYDSYREVYYFGYTFYQHTVSSCGHALPVHVAMGQASESDFTLSLKSLDRFTKACTENALEISISAAAYDAGHDSLGNYEFLLAQPIAPIIALNPRQGQQPNPTGTADRVNAQGIPLCPAGVLMRRHTQMPNQRIVFNCPVKRPTHEAGKTVWKAHIEECPRHVLCQPESKMGPTVYTRADADPRYSPPIRRPRAEFKRLCAQRSGCERSNATKKVTHHLEARPCRSPTHYLMRLYLISIVEHAKAWLAEDRKAWGDDWRVFSESTKSNVAGARK